MEPMGSLNKKTLNPKPETLKPETPKPEIGPPGARAFKVGLLGSIGSCQVDAPECRVL